MGEVYRVSKGRKHIPSLRRIRCYTPFMLNSIKTSMAYRGAFFISLFSRFLTFLVTYYLWKAIFSSSTTDVIRGFTLREMTAYISINFIINIIMGISGGNIATGIARDVSGGEIGMHLIKPISYQGIKLSESLGNLVVNLVLKIVPYYIIFLIIGFTGMISIQSLGLFLISCMLGFLCMFFFGYCFGLCSFYTTYFFGLNMAMIVVMQFFSGSLIPLTFFPENVAKVFRFLPFASISYTPLMIYLDKLSYHEIISALSVQVGWILIFYLLGKLIWNHSIKRLTIFGG